MKLRRNLIGAWLALALVAGVTAALQVGLSHQRLALAKQQQSLQHQAHRLRAGINRLTIELAMLTRPERLRQLAATKLGMRPPLPMQVIRP